MRNASFRAWQAQTPADSHAGALRSKEKGKPDPDGQSRPGWTVNVVVGFCNYVLPRIAAALQAPLR
jgi:hypothetical protein